MATRVVHDEREATLTRRPADLTGGPNELRPIPDPTVLTTAQLTLAIANLRELMVTYIDGKFALVDTRSIENDKAVRLLQDFANKNPTIDVVEEHVKALHNLVDQRFKAIDASFEEKAKATVKAAADVKSAVDAAFAAQKELVNGSFSAMKEFVLATFAAQKEVMTGNQQLAMKLIEGVTTTAMDLKDRIVAMESRGIGQRTGSTDTWSGVSLIISVVVAIAVVVGTVVHLAK